VIEDKAFITESSAERGGRRFKGSGRISKHRLDEVTKKPGTGLRERKSPRDLRDFSGFCGFGKSRQQQLIVCRHF
jgi:hypothetical protein